MKNIISKKGKKKISEIKREINIKEIKEQPKKIKNIKSEEFLEEPEFEDNSPSLKKINISEKEPVRLEENLRKSSTFDKKKNESDSFKYNTGGANTEEAKYHNYNGEMVSNILRRTDVENLGRTGLERRETGFIASPETRLEESKNFERYNPIKRENIENLGKENILERREVKYKPSR